MNSKDIRRNGNNDEERNTARKEVALSRDEEGELKEYPDRQVSVAEPEPVIFAGAGAGTFWTGSGSTAKTANHF